MIKTCQIFAAQPTCFSFRLYFAFIFELEINDVFFFQELPCHANQWLGRNLIETSSHTMGLLLSIFFFFKSSRFMKSVLAPYNKGGKNSQKYQNMGSESLSHMNLSLLNNSIVQIYQFKIENQVKTIKNTFVPHMLMSLSGWGTAYPRSY